jgi:hypothetical protein
MMTREIVWSGASEEGPSILRMKDANGDWYIAIIFGNNSWDSLALKGPKVAPNGPSAANGEM